MDRDCSLDELPCHPTYWVRLQKQFITYQGQDGHTTAMNLRNSHSRNKWNGMGYDTTLTMPIYIDININYAKQPLVFFQAYSNHIEPMAKPMDPTMDPTMDRRHPPPDARHGVGSASSAIRTSSPKATWVSTSSTWNQFRGTLAAFESKQGSSIYQEELNESQPGLVAATSLEQMISAASLQVLLHWFSGCWHGILIRTFACIASVCKDDMLKTGWMTLSCRK
jgi:hypothetical protein